MLLQNTQLSETQDGGLQGLQNSCLKIVARNEHFREQDYTASSLEQWTQNTPMPSSKDCILLCSLAYYTSLDHFQR